MANFLKSIQRRFMSSDRLDDEIETANRGLFYGYLQLYDIDRTRAKYLHNEKFVTFKVWLADRLRQEHAERQAMFSKMWDEMEAGDG